MALALTINGADVLDYLEPGPGNPGLDRALQTRTVMRFVLKDRTGAFRPQLRQEVIATLDGTRIFGGVLTMIDEGDWGDYKGNWFSCEAADYGSVLETIELNGVAPGVTLKDIVQHLVTVRLAARGFSVHPAMAAGPVIGSQGYSFRYYVDIFNDLARITEWPWSVDEFKRILFAPADGRPAPFALTATNDTINTIRVASTLDGYVNVVWLHYGAAGVREVAESWTATAGQTSFAVVNFPNPEGINAPPSIVTVNGAEEAVGTTGQPWSWTAATGTLVRVTGLAAGDAVSTVYGATFPAAIVEANSAEVDTYGEFALVETADDVFDVRQARQIAQGMLAERGGLLRRISVVTHAPGLVPGHVVPVNVPERNIAGDCLVLSSRLVHDGRKANGDEFWRFDLDLVEGTAYRETWQKFFRDIARQTTGAAVSASGLVGPLPIGGVGSGGSAPSLPASVFYRFLGGSRTVAGLVPAAASDPWINIPGFVDAFVDFDSIGTRIVQVSVQCRSHDPAVSVTPRVVSIDGAGNRALVLATGTPTNATAWTYQGMTLPAHAGLTPIRVELSTSVRNRDVFVANAMLNVFGAAAALEREPAA